MTNSGTFLVNGTERVIISQFIRSRCLFQRKTKNIPGFQDYIATVIPSRAWLEIEVVQKNIIYSFK